MAGIALLVCSLVGLAACEGRVGPLAEGMPASGPPVEELPPEGSPPTSGKGEIRIVSFACAPAEGVVALNRVAVNAAVTTLAAGGSGVSLLAFNDHAHFSGERRELLTYR